MRRRKLPAGVQTLRKIREDDCYYVDKTAYIHQLVTGCSHCFLSRPRRFGKSLLVEVRSALNLALLTAMAPDVSATAECSRLEQLLANHDFAGVERLFRAFFASVPHEWYANNNIAHYEGYYSAVFYSHFAGAGIDVVAEESTSHGRSDIVVRHRNAVWVFEFKGNGDAGDALAQIGERGYAEKYRHLDLPIHQVGVAFSEQTRNISAFEVKDA